MKDRISNLICRAIIDKGGINAWVAHRHIIRDQLAILAPSVPDDGTQGFIAYSQGNKRLKLRTGRFFTRKLKLNTLLSDVAIRAIADDINAEFFDDIFDVQLCKGKQITENFRNKVGGTSCMTPPNGSEQYTRLYESNPDKFQQLVIRSDNDSARAIVSKLDDGGYYMDRIYATCDSLKNNMIEYAQIHHWYYYDGNRPPDIMDVSDLDFTNGEIPYMDTLTYYTITATDTMKISNSSRNSDGELGSTCGELEDDDHYSCESCGDRVHADETFSYNGDGICCCDCYNENYSFCEFCNNDGVIENGVQLDGMFYCENCKNEHLYECSNCNEYEKMDDGICSGSGNFYCGQCMGDFTYCETCYGYELTDDGVMVNDEFYCRICKRDKISCCIVCNNHEKTDDGHEIDAGFICSTCADDYTCTECGEVKNTLDDGLCSDCALEKMID